MTENVYHTIKYIYIYYTYNLLYLYNIECNYNTMIIA